MNVPRIDRVSKTANYSVWPVRSGHEITGGQHKIIGTLKVGVKCVSPPDRPHPMGVITTRRGSCKNNYWLLGDQSVHFVLLPGSILTHQLEKKSGNIGKKAVL